MAKPFYEDEKLQQFRMNLPAEQELLRQGGKGGPVCILIKGSLDVSRDGIHLATLEEPGALVGEMSLVLDCAHTATVKTTAPSVCILVPRNELRRLIASIPNFSLRVMRTLAERLEATNSRVTELEDVTDRLYNRLKSEQAEDVQAGTSGCEAEAVRMESDTTVLPSVEEAMASKGRNPLFTRLVRCPAHQGGDSFPIFGLRGHSQRIGLDPYGLSEYHGGADGYAAVDYTLQEVHVCPKCYFAASGRDCFPAATKEKAESFPIRRAILNNLAAHMEERNALVDKLPDRRRLFSGERGLDEAMTAFELGVSTASVFFEYDHSLHSVWGYRMLIYRLKQAQLCRTHGHDETPFLDRTYAFLQEHVNCLVGEPFFHGQCLLVLLADRLEGRAKAEELFGYFDKLRRRGISRLSSRHASLATEYFNRAKRHMEGEA